MEILLVNGRGIALVDDEDAELVVGLRWYRHSKGYACGSGGEPLLHHRIAGKPPSGLLVDHENGDRLDCRRENLRVVTYSINAFNRHAVDKRSRSGVPGVSETKPGVYRVFIWRGTRLYLGARSTLLEAAELRAAAEVEHFGEIAPAMATVLARLRTATAAESDR